jgi:hypothetical protein
MTDYPAVLGSGSNAAVAVGAAPLVSASQHCLSVTVIANDANLDDIFVGDVNLQPIRLVPGNVVSLDISDVSQVFVRSASGVQVADFLLEQ